jgi:DNA polymerase-3 subunit alpha
MANIPTYIKRKHGKEPISYIDPRLEKILKKTFGVVTYQEDVLLIAIELAGYNWETVDKFRKAIGKKIPAEMAKQEKIFIEGCQKHGGLTPEKAEEIWRLFDPFKGYGFNKAHAASYGNVAYQTAYMKANFPAIYMASVLTAESGDTEKIAEIIGECKRMKINVLPPDVNESFGDFTVIKSNKADKDQIRFGLYTIKNLGAEIADFIINERKKNGKFRSFSNFLERVKHRNLNKKSLESLIKSGAIDSLGERGRLLANMEEALEYNKEISKQASQNQDSLFGLMQDQSSVPSFALKNSDPAKPEEKLSWEKELLGLYISGHPLDKFKQKFNSNNLSIKKTKELPNGVITIVAGIVETARLINTKKGDQMAFIKIADMDDEIEVVLFPNTFSNYKDFIGTSKCIAIQGKISDRNGTPSIIAEKIKELKK